MLFFFLKQTSLSDLLDFLESRRLLSRSPPTQEVRDALAALAAGDLTRRAGESGSAELRRIAADVNALGNVLQERKDRKSTRLNSSHANISYAVFCLKKK